MKDEVKNETTEETVKPLSIVDEARVIRDEITAAKEALTTEREALQKVQSEALLSGTAGASVPRVETSENDKKKAQATEMFKGTEIEAALKAYDE